MTKKDLKPESVFHYFFEINNIPRPSKHEEKMIAYLKNFGESRGLDTVVDKAGNVIIRKEATSGKENQPVITLQSHMDMVCDKLVDKNIDFYNDPIETYLDGEWLRANGTTLGADDGIGCAMQLALLDANDIEHGPIECLFTVDEETGLTGANALEAGMLKGQMLLNLDSEDEGLFYVSCAGGKTTTATFKYEKEEAPKGMFFMKASLKGLTGGHSGDDINKKRANALKILARFLYLEQKKMPLMLAQFNSGKLHNAIPRDGSIVFAVPFKEKETVRVDWNIFCSEIEEEYIVTEKNIYWHMESAESEPVLPQSVSQRIIKALQCVHNGVFAICQDPALNEMTETSSNTAVIRTEKNECVIICSQRSSVMSNLENMVNSVSAVFELAEADSIIHNDGYPAWKMNPNSKLRNTAHDCYRRLFGEEPTIKGIHAGLECGLFAANYPALDMLSIGPTMRGVHSPDERLHTPSVEKVWKLVCEIVKNV
ncbi:MAG: aminoacyl-histidine dipeptidase [Prevotella sp.]|nr:aminoacyl-histidine dipeptidase [Candidatus Prevotella equi]